MLSVNIRKRFTDAKAAGGDDSRGGFLLDVVFEAGAGVTILFGASGAGKSMTLRAVAGILRPDAGRITLGGSVLFDSERGVDVPVRERKVGYVFQNLALFPHLDARGNVEFALAHLPRRERRGRAEELLESLHVAHVAGRRPRAMSGGEAQRVALARALAGRPRILLLDEPLSALDEATKRGIISDLKALNRRLGLPVVYVTHSREEAVALGERVVVYERGRVTAQGEPLEVFGSPVSAGVARLTGAENVFEGRVLGRHEEAGTMTVEVRDGRAAGLDAGGRANVEDDDEVKIEDDGETPDAHAGAEDESGAAGASVEAAGACRLEVPLGDYEAGARVRVAVRAGDILLATSRPRDTSARNILRGRVEAVEETGGHVRVRVSSGVGWVAGLTRQSVRELRLAPGTVVWLAFKTYSCHLLD